MTFKDILWDFICMYKIGFDTYFIAMPFQFLPDSYAFKAQKPKWLHHGPIDCTQPIHDFLMMKPNPDMATKA